MDTKGHEKFNLDNPLWLQIHIRRVAVKREGAGTGDFHILELAAKS